MSFVKQQSGLVRNMDIEPTSRLFDDLINFEFASMVLQDNLSPTRSYITGANISEDKNKYTIELSVPGYVREEIHVDIDDNNVLHVSAKKNKDSEETTKNYTKREFSYQSLVRSFAVPETILRDKIKAKCKDGILSIDLPKSETAINKKVKKIKIES
jgi:HSP20 family protein